MNIIFLLIDLILNIFWGLLKIAFFIFVPAAILYGLYYLVFLSDVRWWALGISALVVILFVIAAILPDPNPEE